MKLKMGLFIVFSPLVVWAHKGVHHEPSKKDPLAEEQISLQRINELYLAQIKPIFQNKCFDCHASQNPLPWYAKVPGIKQWIQSDLDEAKEHLNMETDFPFQSHATPLEDLMAIDEAVQKDEMPPFRYRLMHPGSLLTKEEKEKVRQWVQLGIQKLKQTERNDTYGNTRE